ncbi:unnamed protein product, partial [Gongylonema pulchrum]|uniref:GPS domain-containing protein n=1 Tax=Gongylonema pulchrum TaxID=637853 RepID=A0A183DJM8_9BILA
MRLLLELCLLSWMLEECESKPLTLVCNAIYSFEIRVPIIWPDECRNPENLTIVQCKFVRVIPLSEDVPAEITITCESLPAKNRNFIDWSEEDHCYYIIATNGTIYQTCTCSSHFCTDYIYQPSLQELTFIRASVNPFWIMSDISPSAIAFMFAMIFANLLIFVIVFDDITYLYLFICVYFAGFRDSRYVLRQKRQKLWQMEELLKDY